MSTPKQSLITRTIHPSQGYSVSVETWDERGHVLTVDGYAVAAVLRSWSI